MAFGGTRPIAGAASDAADTIAAGKESEARLGVVRPMFEAREKQTVEALVAWFRSQPWDERDAIRYVAILAENRALIEELELRVRKGQDAQARLYSTAE